MSDRPGFILVRPQMGENIGAAARAMLNFGLDHMRIVDPRDGWPNPSAVAMASGAGRVLDSAMVCPDLATGLGDFHFTFATTARPRDLVKSVYSPEEAMQLASQKIYSGQRVGVMFGPERAGLENDDLAQANALITVPVNPEYPSLNLAQCVLLVGYEWRRAQGQITPIEDVMPDTEPARAADIEHLARNYESALDEAGFFFPPHKVDAMKMRLRNMWSRFPLTTQDTRMLHGALRQLVRPKDPS
ncbi:MAG: RNA methyltransferase [Paracoccaceae bacterium]